VENETYAEKRRKAILMHKGYGGFVEKEMVGEVKV
jgi:hypothetical protein